MADARIGSSGLVVGPGCRVWLSGLVVGSGCRVRLSGLIVGSGLCIGVPTPHPYSLISFPHLIPSHVISLGILHPSTRPYSPLFTLAAPHTLLHPCLEKPYHTLPLLHILSHPCLPLTRHCSSSLGSDLNYLSLSLSSYLPLTSPLTPHHTPLTLSPGRYTRASINSSPW